MGVPQTHPARMGAIGRLSAAAADPPDGAGVEIGCAQGFNCSNCHVTRRALHRHRSVRHRNCRGQKLITSTGFGILNSGGRYSRFEPESGWM